MENIPISNALNFIFSVFSRLLDFIASHPLVKWFVLIPICTTVFLCVAYFVLDLTHILDDYNAKNSFLYKGIKQYNKNLAQNRKFEKKNTKKTEYIKADFKPLKKNEVKKIDIDSTYDDKIRFAKMHNNNSFQSSKIEAYYKKQAAFRESEREFNRKNNNIFDIEYED